MMSSFESQDAKIPKMSKMPKMRDQSCQSNSGDTCFWIKRCQNDITRDHRSQSDIWDILWCLWLISHNIDIKIAFPRTSSCMLLKIFFCCKSLSTFLQKKNVFSPIRKYNVFVHYHLSSIGLPTLNASIDKWFFVFGWLSSQCQIKICQAFPCLLSK